jgi:hypothetical protein
MVRFTRHLGFWVFAAAPAIVLATSAGAETPQGAVAREATPYANTITAEELARLRGGASVSAALPAVRLWDEVGGRGQPRPTTPGVISLNGGTLTIRVGGR